MCLAVQKKYRSKIDGVRMVTLMAFIEQDYKIGHSTTNDKNEIIMADECSNFTIV